MHNHVKDFRDLSPPVSHKSIVSNLTKESQGGHCGSLNALANAEKALNF